MPLVSLAIAVAALVAAVLSGEPEREKEQRTFVELPLSDTRPWLSLDEAAPLRIAGEGRRWLAFRAFSRSAPGRLRIAGDDGTRFALRLATTPQMYVVGPIQLDGLGSYWLDPEPPPGERTGGNRREVFVSELRLSRRPVGALPGKGFWGTEFLDDGATPANWLKTRATMEVASQDPSLRRASLAFDVSSIDNERVLTVKTAGRSWRVTVPERGATRHVVIGPFSMRGGRAFVELSSPGALRYGADPRRRTVRVSALEALVAPSGG